MKKILIAGGAGFIGSNLCKELLKDNNFILCIDNLSSGNLNNIKDFFENKNFKFINRDIINPLNDLSFYNFNEIYNLACPASPINYQLNPIHTTLTSVVGSKNLLDLALKCNSKILFTSTSEVYGNPLEHPQRENYYGNVNPNGIRSCYDEGKRCAESLFFDYNRIYNIDIRIIRIFNTYGPNMQIDDGRVISNFINQALRNKDITIYGDGSQTRSFQYIDDLINGIKLMMNTKDFIGPVNIGNPEEYTIKEIAYKIINLTNSKSSIIYKELPKDDPIRRKPDITLAKEKLSYNPKISLSEGLQKTIHYFKNIL